MVYPIVLYGNPILREISLDIPLYSNVSNIINKIQKTLNNCSFGVGLAANQININSQIFIVNINYENYIFNQVFINPNIILKSKEANIFEEGCLSLPNITENIERSNLIRIEFYDENWNYHRKDYKGLESRIIQHEYDHLKGILFLDHLSKEKQIKLLPTLKEITERKVKVNYPTI